MTGLSGISNLGGMTRIELEDRIRELEIILGSDLKTTMIYRALGLSRTHCQVLGFLMQRERAPREQMYIAVYGARNPNEQPDIRTLDAHIYYIRRALAPLGVSITTVRDSGWMMTKANKTTLRNWLATQEGNTE